MFKTCIYTSGVLFGMQCLKISIFPTSRNNSFLGLVATVMNVCNRNQSLSHKFPSFQGISLAFLHPEDCSKMQHFKPNLTCMGPFFPCRRSQNSCISGSYLVLQNSQLALKNETILIRSLFCEMSSLRSISFIFLEMVSVSSSKEIIDCCN